MFDPRGIIYPCEEFKIVFCKDDRERKQMPRLLEVNILATFNKWNIPWKICLKLFTVKKIALKIPRSHEIQRFFFIGLLFLLSRLGLDNSPNIWFTITFKNLVLEVKINLSWNVLWLYCRVLSKCWWYNKLKKTRRYTDSSPCTVYTVHCTLHSRMWQGIPQP